MGFRAASRVLTRDATQVELINDFDNVAGQMAFVQPVINRGRPRPFSAICTICKKADKSKATETDNSKTRNRCF